MLCIQIQFADESVPICIVCCPTYLAYFGQWYGLLVKYIAPSVMRYVYVKIIMQVTTISSFQCEEWLRTKDGGLGTDT
ncbi:MAG TPA: hypothetical protein DE109_03330 [Aeromonas sp.]|nr:hypothetical protein [Aeromonas sp.]